MPLACFGQMDSLEYRLRSHIRTSLRTFYILKIVLLPRNPWQHIAYLKLNQPKIKATKFPQKIVCGNATDTALYISANGNAAETLRKRETRPHFALTCFRPPEMWRKLEPSDFRKISEIRKRLISPCVKPTHDLACTSRMRKTISPGQWQPWTAVSPLLGPKVCLIQLVRTSHRPKTSAYPFEYFKRYITHTDCQLSFNGHLKRLTHPL